MTHDLADAQITSRLPCALPPAVLHRLKAHFETFNRLRGLKERLCRRLLGAQDNARQSRSRFSVPHH